jgi:hemoglobin/transferrin/lactoferrin receptor protein
LYYTVGNAARKCVAGVNPLRNACVNNRMNRFCSILIPTGLLFLTIAKAEETPPEALPDMVVTATLDETPSVALPYSVGSLSGETIQLEKLYRTVPESLREIPSIAIQKTTHGQGSPFIRGFTGFRTLFLIDGVRLNNSTFRDGPNQYWTTVDLFQVDRFEIVKGPASSLYGSDAIGGTVHARSASAFVKGPKDWGSRTYYRYSSAEDSHIARQEGRVNLGENGAFRAGVTVKDFGELESGAGTLPETDYDEWGADFRADYFFSDDARLSLAHQAVDQNDVVRVHRTVFAVPFKGTEVGDEFQRVLDQDRTLTYARLEADALSGWVDGLELVLSRQVQEEERFRLRSGDRRDLQGFDVETYGLSLQLRSVGSAGIWHYGLDLYRDEVDSFRHTLDANKQITSSSIQGPVGDDAQYDTLGLFFQNTYPFTERFEIISGARYSFNEADVGRYEDPLTGDAASLEETFDTVSGNVRGLYRLFPDNRLNLFAGVSQGFRAPNLSDLTRLDTARSNEIETAAPNLDPERFLAWETGVKSQQENYRFEAAAYYTDMKDLIVRTPTGRMIDGDSEVTKRNAASGYVYGAEVSAGRQVARGWWLSGLLSWMDGESDAFPTAAPTKVRESLSRLMPPSGRVTLRYDSEGIWWVEASVWVVDEQDQLSSRDEQDTQRIPPGGTPGYEIFTLRGGLNINENLTLSLALENLGDENYRVHGSGINEPGRNVVVAADFRF